MTPQYPQTIHRGDQLLKRIKTRLARAMVFLVIPATFATQAHLSFAGWVFVPLLISLALWAAVTIVIAVGQRYGMVGTKLFPPTSLGLDLIFEVPKCEPPPAVRKADDTLPPGSVPVTHGPRIHVAHIPGRGAVSYSIG